MWADVVCARDGDGMVMGVNQEWNEKAKGRGVSMKSGAKIENKARSVSASVQRSHSTRTHASHHSNTITHAQRTDNLHREGLIDA